MAEYCAAIPRLPGLATYSKLLRSLSGVRESSVLLTNRLQQARRRRCVARVQARNDPEHTHRCLQSLPGPVVLASIGDTTQGSWHSSLCGRRKLRAPAQQLALKEDRLPSLA